MDLSVADYMSFGLMQVEVELRNKPTHMQKHKQTRQSLNERNPDDSVP